MSPLWLWFKITLAMLTESLYDKLKRLGSKEVAYMTQGGSHERCLRAALWELFLELDPCQGLEIRISEAPQLYGSAILSIFSTILMHKTT